MKQLTVSDGSSSPAERMRWSLVLVQFLAVLALGIRPSSGAGSLTRCPCPSLNLCQPLPADHQYQVEAVVFDNGGSAWMYYDWSKVTTIVTTQPVNPSLLCQAHEHSVRLVLKEKIRQTHLKNKKDQDIWIRDMAYFVSTQFMDGIYLELSHLVTNFKALPKLLMAIKEIFHHKLPGSQVSISVPWSPDCPDGKCYDYTSMAQSCDFLYVKAYDMQLEMWDECFAKANAPYDQTFSGLSHYIQLGVNPKKLILGLPWYGNDFPCQHFYEPGRCKLSKYVFNGAPCSSQIAKRIAYKDIMQLIPRSFTGRYWDDNYKSPYFVYMDKDVYHEVWYDDPQSLSLKSSIVKKLKLGGIGVQFGNNLNYSANPTAAMQTEDMWNALCPTRLKWRT
ncbi:di-N-acetylchitobiase-like [Chiloscyllium plagiosum]|uniref:di-N-acetylchitobiase-like n=1 Tax=Chiloscyllium plagiosum TaxID=36176 RepID=UPI001CB7F0D6|nr:di-N-acetylchitobiase-like [Chiloscyllium plagiosum]